MATIVYPYGEATVNVAANEKIAVLGYSPVQVYQEVGYPNFPSQLELLATTVAGSEYVSAAFTSAAIVVLRPSAAVAFYETGSDPSVSDPSPDISAAATPWTATGLAAAQGGSMTLKGGTSSTAGNAGGASALLGGQPGATGVGGAANVTGGAGGATSGKGGAVNITAGAGTNGNASGGSVVIAAGAKNGSGLNGVIYNRSTISRKMTVTAMTTTATITVTALLGGMITANQGAAGAATYTMPTGTVMAAALPTDFTTGDSFDFTVTNLSTVAAEDVTLAGDTDMTAKGNVFIPSNAATSDVAFGTFRVLCTGTHTYDFYRIG